jgi:hypothetical protein
MSYIRVQWIHQHPGKPIWLLSELDDERWETRKIEIYADGSKGYASKTEVSGRTFLGERPVPSLAEIGADPQFIPQEITREEFEAEWSARCTHRARTHSLDFIH